MNQGMGSDGASPSPFAARLGESVVIKSELLPIENHRVKAYTFVGEVVRASCVE